MKIKHAIIPALLAASFSCAALAGSAASEPILIGVSGPFSGNAASVGVSMRDGIRLAATQINQQGGIYGHPIHLVEKDDANSIAASTTIAKEFAEQYRVAAVLGYCDTDAASAAQKTLQSAKIPSIAAVASGAAVTQQFSAFPTSYVFRVAATDAAQQTAMVKEVVDGYHARKIALLHANTSQGKSWKADFSRLLNERNLAPVDVETFEPRDAGMEAQLSKARASGAELVVAEGGGAELAAISNSMAHMNWRVLMVSGWNAGMLPYTNQAGTSGNGTRMPQTFFQGTAVPQQAAFVATYKNVFKVERLPSPSASAQGYDAMMIMASAIKQAHSTDGTKIQAALENLHDPVNGMLKTYNQPFGKKNHEAITADMVYMGEISDGRIVKAHP